MTYDFCLGCGVLLGPHAYQCPVCGFINGFDDEGELILNDEFLLEDDYLD